MIEIVWSKLVASKGSESSKYRQKMIENEQNDDKNTEEGNDNEDVKEHQNQEESQKTAHKLLTSDLVVWTLRRSGIDQWSGNVQKSK